MLVGFTVLSVPMFFAPPSGSHYWLLFGILPAPLLWLTNVFNTAFPLTDSNRI